MLIIKFLFIFLFGFIVGSFDKKENLIVINYQKKPIEKEVIKEKVIVVQKECYHSGNEKRGIASDLTNKKFTYTPAILSKHNNNKKFRLRALAGYGLTGNNQISDSNNSFSVNSESGFIYGAGLDYKIYQDYSIGIQVLSNQGTLGSFGYDF